MSTPYSALSKDTDDNFCPLYSAPVPSVTSDTISLASRRVVGRLLIHLHPFIDELIQNITHLDSFLCAEDFELKL